MGNAQLQLSLRLMGDDPTKKEADAKRVSKQPHEVAYQKRKAAGKTATKKKKPCRYQ